MDTLEETGSAGGPGTAAESGSADDFSRRPWERAPTARERFSGYLTACIKKIRGGTHVASPASASAMAAWSKGESVPSKKYNERLAGFCRHAHDDSFPFDRGDFDRLLGEARAEHNKQIRYPANDFHARPWEEEPPERQFGAYLKACRLERGNTQVEAAKALGIHESALSLWEAGKRASNASFEPKLAAYCREAHDEAFPFSEQYFGDLLTKSRLHKMGPRNRSADRLEITAPDAANQSFSGKPWEQESTARERFGGYLKACMGRRQRPTSDASKVSKAVLLDEIGVSHSTFNHWAQGIYPPPEEHREKLAAFCEKAHDDSAPFDRGEFDSLLTAAQQEHLQQRGNGNGHSGRHLSRERRPGGRWF